MSSPLQEYLPHGTRGIIGRPSHRVLKIKAVSVTTQRPRLDFRSQSERIRELQYYRPHGRRIYVDVVTARGYRRITGGWNAEPEYQQSARREESARLKCHRTDPDGRSA